MPHWEWTMYEECVDGMSVILDWIIFFIYFNSYNGGSSLRWGNYKGVGWWAIATDFFLWIPDTLYKLWGQQQQHYLFCLAAFSAISDLFVMVTVFFPSCLLYLCEAACRLCYWVVCHIRCWRACVTLHFSTHSSTNDLHICCIPSS
jgi:hypothetical protein